MNIGSARLKWLIGGTVTFMFLLSALLVWSTVSLAQTTPIDPDGPAQVSSTSAMHALPGDVELYTLARGDFDFIGSMPGHGQNDLYTTRLAAELGITVEKLRAAQQAAHTAVIQQLVTDGELTQEQADRMLAMVRLRDYIDPDALKAKALGITVAELKAARSDGKTMAEMLESQGLDYATYRANLAAAYAAAVDQAVTDGVITADQAEQLRNSRPGGPGNKPGRGSRHPEWGGF